MQPSNTDQNITFHNQLWYLLAEFSASEFLSEYEPGGEPITCLLLQKMHEVGMPRENLESIDQMLSDFTEGMQVDLKQKSSILPWRIRVYCQKRMIDDAYSAQTEGLFASEDMIEPAQTIHPSRTKMNGGWGCFLVKRGGNVSGDASPISHYLVDLYLYKEG